MLLKDTGLCTIHVSALAIPYNIPVDYIVAYLSVDLITLDVLIYKEKMQLLLLPLVTDVVNVQDICSHMLKSAYS